jgi:hypothetical protein
MNMVSLAWKLIEQQCQDKLVFFLSRRLQEKRLQPPPSKKQVVFVAWKQSTVEEQHQDQSCFSREITGTKATTPPPKSILGLISGEGGLCMY